MTYFNTLDRLLYKFGDEVTSSVFQNLTSYADMIDDLKDAVSFHEKYTIQQGERPDQVSFKFYNTTEHYWTFYLLNDNIRQQGWPLTRHELEVYIRKVFPNTVLTIRDTNLPIKFKVGQSVSGGTSGASGKIIKRNLDLGQIFVEGDVGFTQGGELLTSVNSSGVSETLSSVSSSKEYLAASHYIDGSSNIVDIDPASGPGALLTEKTNEDVYFATNESLRQIKIIRPSQITNISTSFKRSVRG